MGRITNKAFIFFTSFKFCFLFTPYYSAAVSSFWDFYKKLYKKLFVCYNIFNQIVK